MVYCCHGDYIAGKHRDKDECVCVSVSVSVCVCVRVRVRVYVGVLGSRPMRLREV